MLVLMTLLVLAVQCVQCHFNNGEFKSVSALLGLEEARDVQHVVVSGRREGLGLEMELEQGKVVDAVVRNVELGESDVRGGWLKPLARGATCLRFQACRFGEGSLAALLQGILQDRGSTAVKWLSLHHCAVDAASLNDALPPLKEAKWGKGAVNEGAGAAVAAATAAAEEKEATVTCALNVLDLSHNELDLASIQAACRIMQRVPSVHTLALDMNPLSPPHMRALSQGLKKGGAGSSMVTLSLSGCGLSDKSAPSVVSLLRSQKALTCLDLSGNSLLGVNFMERLASALRKGAGQGLQELDLSYTSIGDGGCRVLTHALRSGHLPSLRSLKVRGIGATGKSLDALLSVEMDKEAAAAIVLRTMDISGNDLFAPKKKDASDKGAKAIPQKFMAAMKCLGLDETLKSSLELSMSSLEAYGLVGGKEKKSKRYSMRSNSNIQRALKYNATFQISQDDARRGKRVEHRRMAIKHESAAKEDPARLQERHSIKTLAQLVAAMATPGAAISVRDLQLNRVGLTAAHMARICKLAQKKLPGVERVEEGDVGNQRSACSISVRFNNLPPGAVEAMAGAVPIDIAH